MEMEIEELREVEAYLVRQAGELRVQNTRSFLNCGLGWWLGERFAELELLQRAHERAMVSKEKGVI